MNTTDSTILTPTPETFEQDVLNSSVPVLVDFWAEWCPPCKMLKPELQRLAPELAGKARIAMVNVDEHPSLAAAFRVSSIPALAIVSGGRVVDAWAGFVPKAVILQRLQSHFAA